MFLLLNGWCLMWEIDRFWFREPFGTDGIFWKFEFRIYFWQVFFFTASCWTATTQYSRNRIFKFVEIEVVVTCLVAIGVQTNCLTCLAKRGLTGKQHSHSYLNRGPSVQKLTSSLTKNTSFQNVGWSDIQCFDGNNIGRWYYRSHVFQLGM